MVIIRIHPNRYTLYTLIFIINENNGLSKTQDNNTVCSTLYKKHSTLNVMLKSTTALV